MYAMYLSSCGRDECLCKKKAKNNGQKASDEMRNETMRYRRVVRGYKVTNALIS